MQGLDDTTSDTNEQRDNLLDDHLDELQQEYADARDQEMDDFFSEEFDRQHANCDHDPTNVPSTTNDVDSQWADQATGGQHICTDNPAGRIRALKAEHPT